MVDRSIYFVLHRGLFGSSNEFDITYKSGDKTLAAEGSISKEEVRKHVDIFLSGQLPVGVEIPKSKTVRRD